MYVIVLILFFVLDILFSMYGEVKEYQIDEKGIIRIVCYLGFSKAMIKDVTQVFLILNVRHCVLFQKRRSMVSYEGTGTVCGCFV